MAKQFFI